MVNGTGQDSVRSDHYILHCSVTAVSCRTESDCEYRTIEIGVSSVCYLPAQSGLISSKRSNFVLNIFFALETVYLVSLYVD